MRSNDKSIPSAFAHAFLVQLPLWQRAGCSGMGALLWEALVLSDPTERESNSTKTEIAAAVADLIVAARHLVAYGEQLEEFDDLPDEPLCRLAADCGTRALAAIQPLVEALTPTPAEVARTEMACGAQLLRQLQERLDRAAKDLDPGDPHEEEIAGLLAFLRLHRIGPAIAEFQERVATYKNRPAQLS